MTNTPRPGRPDLSVIVAAISALVLIAAVILGAIMWTDVRDHSRTQDDRAAAQAAAEQFALRMDAFDGANLDAYVKSVEPLLTTRQKTVFGQQITQFKQVYEAAAKAAGKADQKPGQGRIQYSGVTDADNDSATVLVAHDSTIAGQSESLHFRWQLTLRHIGGKWLIDDFVPVN